MYVFLTEILHGFCHQRHAFGALHAGRKGGIEIQALENCRVYTVRVFHHDTDCPQHYSAYDEGNPRPFFKILHLFSRDENVTIFNQPIIGCRLPHFSLFGNLGNLFSLQ